MIARALIARLFDNCAGYTHAIVSLRSHDLIPLVCLVLCIRFAHFECLFAKSNRRLLDNVAHPAESNDVANLNNDSLKFKNAPD